VTATGSHANTHNLPPLFSSADLDDFLGSASNPLSPQPSHGLAWKSFLDAVTRAKLRSQEPDEEEKEFHDIQEEEGQY